MVASLSRRTAERANSLSLEFAPRFRLGEGNLGTRQWMTKYRYVTQSYDLGGSQNTKQKAGRAQCRSTGLRGEDLRGLRFALAASF
jgi:hypothetical protein